MGAAMVAFGSAAAWGWRLRRMGAAGLPFRGTRIVVPEALLAIPDASPACIRHWRRQASVPNPPGAVPRTPFRFAQD